MTVEYGRSGTTFGGTPDGPYEYVARGGVCIAEAKDEHALRCFVSKAPIWRQRPAKSGRILFIIDERSRRVRK